MQNITELLKNAGIEIPAEKAEAFNKSFIENYKTIAEVERLQNSLKTAEERLTTRDNDLKELQKQLEGVGDAPAKLKELESKYTADAEAHAKAIASQRYEFMCREKVAGLKFTSNSAKKAFTSDLLAKNLAVEGDDILGFNDFVEAYKKQDATAFEVDGDKPTFTGKAGATGEGAKEKTSFANFF